uniref:Peptidase S74 domain-containing protein n=1 Tax=Angiostrongylus cantonensis TaxID=6313 RepID=A0A0K0DND8_ANGCA
MQKINFTPYFSDKVNDKNVLIADGVVSRLHKYKSGHKRDIYNVVENIEARTVEQLMSPFQCKHGDKWKVYDRKSMATRKHFQKTPRVGDIIIQGQPGTRFYKDVSMNWNLTGDHGYDYINPTMHTIFYAMGPSIKKGSFLPAFQNIEYMNLWLNGPLAVAERLVRGQVELQSSCIFSNRKYGACTSRGNSLGFITQTISACKSDFANISPIVIPWRSGFVNDVLDPLNRYTRSLVDRFGQLVVITGAACDYDYDEIADSETRFE